MNLLQRKHSDERLEQCPGCDVKLPEADSWAQIEHMRAYHPEIIEQRQAALDRLRGSYD